MSQALGVNAKKYKLMVIGKTGAGKSSFCNFVLGVEHFEAFPGLESVTAKAAAGSVRLQGYELYLIDTPGFGDPSKIEDMDDTGFEEMAKGLQLAVEDGVAGVDVIVYVLSASVRFTKDDNAAIKAFGDEKFWSHVLVVFTHADGVRHEDKRQYILNVLDGGKCPEALRLMMDRVDRRFMIINSIDESPAYREENRRALLKNLHKMRENNGQELYSHHLFDRVTNRYIALKNEARKRSESRSKLTVEMERIKEANVKEMRKLGDVINNLKSQLHDEKLHGEDVEALNKRVRDLEEEKSAKALELEEEMQCKQAEIEQLRRDYNEEVAQRENLQNDVADLKRELKNAKCDRLHLCSVL